MALATARQRNNPDSIEFTVKAVDDLVLRGSERTIVRVAANHTYSCLMLKNQRFSSLFRHYSKHHGLPKDSLLYFFTEEINGDDTPEQIHLLKNDVVFVRPRPCGVHLRKQAELADKAYIQELGAMLDSCEHSDVTFVVGPEQVELQAHKAILAARCDYFRAMFRKIGLGMLECNNGVIRIRDYSVDAFKRLLEYIYTNRISCISTCSAQDIIDLLSIADQYLLPKLKQLCENSSTVYLSCDNVARLLHAAEQHSAPQLKQSCQDFIVDNIATLTETSTFRQEMESFPSMAVSVLKAMVPSITPPAAKRRRITTEVEEEE